MNKVKILPQYDPLGYELGYSISIYDNEDKVMFSIGFDLSGEPLGIVTDMEDPFMVNDVNKESVASIEFFDKKLEVKCYNDSINQIYNTIIIDKKAIKSFLLLMKEYNEFTIYVNTVSGFIYTSFTTKGILDALKDIELLSQGLFPYNAYNSINETNKINKERIN